jgi:diguanylate cyclase (GGDEF)-like protein
LAFALGISFLAVDILFAWEGHLYKYLFMFCFLLEPLILALMMIPGTRQRFEHYFFLEEQTARYVMLESRDGVTGLYNKGHFMPIVDESINYANREEKPLAFMMIDIDHFHDFNETWGYPEGDKVMLFLAKLVRRCLRESDVAAHYGGGEFGVVLPGGSMPSAVLIAERIREAFEKQSQSTDKKKALTLSVGLSFLVSDDTLVTLVQRASEALYHAKVNGRNRTEFEGTP